jgi:hypothetical protein
LLKSAAAFRIAKVKAGSTQGAEATEVGEANALELLMKPEVV